MAMNYRTFLFLFPLIAMFGSDGISLLIAKPTPVLNRRNSLPEHNGFMAV